MRNFEFSSKVRAFARLGNQKEPRWKDAIYLGNNTVEFWHGTVLTLEDHHIKRIQKLEYVNYEWPALNSYVADNWEKLKITVNDAMGKFFPEVAYNFDEKDHTVKVNEFFISPAVVEQENRDSFVESAGWQLSVEMYRAGSYWEPPDVDVADLEYGDSDFIVSKLLNAIWNAKTEIYWENKWCDNMAEDCNG
jgi:hypothetical protein